MTVRPPRPLTNRGCVSDSPSEPDLGWHVMPGELLLNALRRVAKGEDPDLVFAELWANADHEQVDGDDD